MLNTKEHNTGSPLYIPMVAASTKAAGGEDIYSSTTHKFTSLSLRHFKRTDHPCKVASISLGSYYTGNFLASKSLRGSSALKNRSSSHGQGKLNQHDTHYGQELFQRRIPAPHIWYWDQNKETTWLQWRKATFSPGVHEWRCRKWTNNPKYPDWKKEQRQISVCIQNEMQNPLFGTGDVTFHPPASLLQEAILFSSVILKLKPLVF